MATNYPGSLDSLTNPAAGDALNSPSHAGQHANANDAIEAIEAELGTDPAGASATVKARFEAIEANDWVTAARIAADAVGSSEIAANAVGSSELADNAVDTAAIADGAVTSAKIADGTIVDADINAAAAIARSKISGLPTSSTDNTLPRFDSTAGALQTSGVVVDDNNRLTVATGSTGGYGFASGAVHLSGTGTPESVVTAAPGSTWLQTDSTVDVKGWIRWVKATGTGNTGWVAGPEADTGWRQLSADFTPPAGGTIYDLRVRRVGPKLLYVYVKYTSTAGAVQTDTLTGSLDAAFRPFGISQAGMGDDTGVRFKGFGYYNGTIKIRNETTSASTAYLNTVFETDATWPTSLPGTAV